MEWIRATELAKIKGVSDRSVRKLVTSGKYIGRKICQRYEVLVSSIEQEWQDEVNKLYSTEISTENFNTPISEKSKKRALTKFDIVMKWRAFCVNYKGKKVDAIKEFVSVYNNMPNKNNQYENINNIAISTIMRWDRLLKENADNWKVLAPKYKSQPNKDKFSEKEKETVLKILLSPNQPNIGKAIKLTKHLLLQQGVTNLACEMTYRRFISKYKQEHYDMWIFAREGAKALRDKVIPYIERDILKLNVGDVLIGDGHRLAFEVINPFTGKPCRPTIAAYQDWKSGAMVGFEVMLEENTQCIASALRNSIIALGKYPKFVYQDNGKAYKADYFTADDDISGLFIKLGITPIFAKPYNAKAKPIERFFREMQDSFERILPSFVGSCIDNKPAYKKRNERFHKEIHNNYIPTMDEVINYITRWMVNFHYAQPCPNVEGLSIGEVFDAGKGNGIDISTLDDLMMVNVIKNIGRNGIRFLKFDYYHESLYGLRTQVVIKYSLFDLSYIKVFTMSGEFLCTAERLAPIHPLANYTGEAKDVEELKQRIKQQKELEKQTVKQYLRELKKEKVYLPALNETDNVIYKPSKEDKKLLIESLKEDEIQPEKIVFHNKYERYDYLKNKPDLSEDEQKWVDNYEKSTEYKLLYGVED